MNKILIIDDDRELCALIKRSVQTENIAAAVCSRRLFLTAGALRISLKTAPTEVSSVCILRRTKSS